MKLWHLFFNRQVAPWKSTSSMTGLMTHTKKTSRSAAPAEGLASSTRSMHLQDSFAPEPPRALTARAQEKQHEAFQPTDEQRECPTADSFNARLVSEAKLDAAMAEASALLAAHEAQARPTARVFVTHYCTWDDIGRLVKIGYGLKYIGRGYVEAVMK